MNGAGKEIHVPPGDWVPANQAFKLTRLSACQLGGPGSVENAAARWLCTPSAVQLNAGVSRLKEQVR